MPNLLAITVCGLPLVRAGLMASARDSGECPDFRRAIGNTFLSIDCVLPVDSPVSPFYVKSLVFMFVPVAVVVIALVVYGAIFWYEKRRLRFVRAEAGVTCPKCRGGHTVEHCRVQLRENIGMRAFTLPSRAFADWGGAVVVQRITSWPPYVL